jgi:NAD(P)-dependent dehydrogenase (short-subunit alcohol dehydrogenase family)
MTVALVTGGTSGIGFYIARALSARGDRLFVTGRDPSRGARAVALLRASGAHEVEFIAVDHASVAANRSLALEIARRTERIDVLVNNVGAIFGRRDLTADNLEATLAVNFVGPAKLTTALLPTLRVSGGPRVVNVVSGGLFLWKRSPFDDIQSERHFVGLEAYAHAKLLNAMWTMALARREAAHLVANAVDPGTAWTPMNEHLSRDAVPAWRYVWPLVRVFQKLRSAESAAAAPIRLATAADLAAVTGRFLEKKWKRLPRAARDESLQDRVWELAVSLGGP